MTEAASESEAATEPEPVTEAVAEPGAGAAPVAEAAEAGEHPLPPPKHDAGFIMRINAGFGGLYGHFDEDQHASGFGGGFAISAGTFVFPGLALTAGTVNESFVNSEPTVGGEIEVRDIAVLMTGALTLGVSYYVPRVDIFASVEAGMSYAYASVYRYVTAGGGSEVTRSRSDWTDPGFALRVTAGKDWWVGRSWALGFAVSYRFTTYGDKDDGEINLEQSHGISVMFSATFDRAD